jgi:hypothetical protein
VALVSVSFSIELEQRNPVSEPFVIVSVSNLTNEFDVVLVEEIEAHNNSLRVLFDGDVTDIGPRVVECSHEITGWLLGCHCWARWDNPSESGFVMRSCVAAPIYRSTCLSVVEVSMYKPVPDSYWVDSETGTAHIIDSHGEPGPIVRKPLCVTTDYETLIEGDEPIPDGVWVEGTNSPLETSRFGGVQPRDSIPRALCEDCEKRYFDLLWTRPARYPTIEVTVQTETGDTTYLVTDINFRFESESNPTLELTDAAGRTKQIHVERVTEIVPHASIPVVY